MGEGICPDMCFKLIAQTVYANFTMPKRTVYANFWVDLTHVRRFESKIPTADLNPSKL